jgi:hypothetical protein
MNLTADFRYNQLVQPFRYHAATSLRAAAAHAAAAPAA